MSRRLVRRLALLSMTLVAAIALVPAQTINIDLGFPGTGPPDSYRGVGMPGHWHSFEATTWGFFYDLVDIHGNPTNARVRQIGGTEIVEIALGGPGEPQGGDAILLGDALVTHQIENCLFFQNLQNGRYEVISYAWMPTAPTTLNHVWIDDHPDEPLIGGSWPGVQKQGVTYARHEFNVVSGVINMHSGIPSGGNPNPGAALSGIQIRRMVAQPPLFVDRTRIDWLAALDAVSYDVVRGDLATLRSTGGDFSAATETCLASSTSARTLFYGTDPGPGVGHWFLVRGHDGGGPMTWNSPGTTQAGDRDPELVAACP